MRQSVFSLILLLFVTVPTTPLRADDVVSHAITPTAQSFEEKLQRSRAERAEEKPSEFASTKDDNTGGATASKMAQSLGILLSLFLIGAWAYKKYFLRNTPMVERKLHVLDRVSLAPRANLLLAEVDGHKILIGIAGDGISMLKVGGKEAIKLTEEYEQ